MDGLLHGIEWIMFHGYLDCFQKPPLGGSSNTKAGDHGTPNVHNRWFILFHHVSWPAWIEIHWNSIWLRARSHTLEDPWSHYMILEMSWDGLGHFHLGSHNFMVTTLGSCVKWPLMILKVHLPPPFYYLHIDSNSKKRLEWVYPLDPNIFLQICTHTHIITISSDLCPPMLFKLRPCIKKLCNVCYPPTPNLGWIGQIKSWSLSLASAWSTSWLAYSLHPRSLTPIWSWMQGCTIISNPCPPKTHGHGHPM